MKYSYQWIQSHIAEKLPSPESLRETIIFHAFEVESAETVGEDTIFDIKVLPDRSGDCLSHVGMAREIAGLLGLTFIQKESPALPTITEIVPVEIKNENCKAYAAVRVNGIAVMPSPKWLAKALESIGQRSINNIVDATNYVLFDCGQPVHAFDAASVDGGIVVRLAHDGETMKLLGGEEKTLKATDLVIADYIGALAIAGVKGGATAEVSTDTKDIIIEVANFDPIAVRKTSRRLGLITDASKRFENGASSTLVPDAMAQVVALILEIAGGAVRGVTMAGATTVAGRTMSFETADITRLLGTSITESDIVSVFDRYHYTYTHEKNTFTLAIPWWRADITGVHDIAEEIGRVVGYDRIPALALPDVFMTEQNPTDIQIASVRAWAVAQNYREVYQYAFRAKGEVSIAYGAKGKDKLRANLSDGLKESYELNRLHAPLLGLSEVKLFEIGTVFLKDAEEVRVAMCDKGSIQELTLAEFITEKGIMVPTELHTDGVLVAPHPFIAWSSYPFITRDIAVWVSSQEDANALKKVLTTFAAEHCVREPYLFDTFTKDNRTSVAYRLVFQSPEKTLTDDEVTEVFAPLIETLKSNSAFEIR